MLEAAKAGLHFGQERLLSHYGREDFDNQRTIRKALCWGRLADRHSPWARFDSYTDRLRAAARDPDASWKAPLRRPELRRLADQWDPRITPHDRMPITIEDCIRIEEEK